MLIKDVGGKYELRVDKTRRIVYEKFIGMLTVEDYKGVDSSYRTKIIPYLGNGAWVKFCDAKQWTPSTSPYPDAINEHLGYISQHDFSGGVMLVDSATLKMQINRVSKDIILPQYFDDERKADEWLKSRGF